MCSSFISLQRLRSAAALFALLLLSACATQPPTKTTSGDNPATIEAPKPIPQAPELLTEWDTYQKILGDIDQWQVQGKLGVRLPDNSGSVYFNWKQRPDDFAIHLSGPLGQGTTWIRGNDRQVSLERPNQTTILAKTPEALMQKGLGWWLPISQLYYWVRGIPAPQTHPSAQQHHDDGSLKFLEQDGWQLEYSRYKSVSGWSLPSKVIARQQDIKLTFIIKNWKLQ
ncbi:MAG: lipoprotein insertase outer membrane protein LolB [Cellvibrionaceae bacterium]